MTPLVASERGDDMQKKSSLVSSFGTIMGRSGTYIRTVREVLVYAQIKMILDA